MRARYGVLFLLVLLSVITYLDRICIAVAGTRMQAELGLTSKQWGWVMGAFILSYGLFEIPTGAMGDRLGQRGVLARIVVWWSLFTSLTAMVSSFRPLVLVRFLFGMGEAGAFPNMAGSIGRWFPAVERGRAQGLMLAASRIGGALTPLLVVPMMVALGWRAPFMIFGSLGLLWAAVWYAWYRDDPARHAAVTPAELAEIGERDSAPGHANVPWGVLFRQPQLWLLMAMYSCYVWGAMFYLTWFPEYLEKGRGLTQREVQVAASLPFILGTLGNVLGGFLTDRLSRRYGLLIGRRVLGTVCLGVSAFLLLATALTHGKLAGVVFLALGFGIMDCMLPSAWAICLDVGGRHAGAVGGAMNSAGQAGGFLCSILFGHLVAEYHDYATPLLAIAAMVLVSAVLFSRLDPTRPLLPVKEMPAETAA